MAVISWVIFMKEYRMGRGGSLVQMDGIMKGNYKTSKPKERESLYTKS